MRKRLRSSLRDVGPPNPYGRSGHFQFDGDPEDDGVLRGRPYLDQWTGIVDLQDITTDIPPPNALVPLYHHEFMPYNWS